MSNWGHRSMLKCQRLNQKRLMLLLQWMWINKTRKSAPPKEMPILLLLEGERSSFLVFGCSIAGHSCHYILSEEVFSCIASKVRRFLFQLEAGQHFFQSLGLCRKLLAGSCAFFGSSRVSLYNCGDLVNAQGALCKSCLLYTSPSPRDTR